MTEPIHAPDYKRCSSGDKCLHPEGPVLPATREYFHQSLSKKDGFQPHCRACKLGTTDPPPLRQQVGAKFDPLYSKSYYQTHKAERAEYQKARLPIRRLNNQRRKARLRELPAAFTYADWQRALAYFGGCAITGATENLHADHWIPLSSPECPGTVPGNIIPLCAELNVSKNDSDPYEWLVWKFGEEEARRIWERISSYFEWLLK